MAATASLFHQPPMHVKMAFLQSSPRYITAWWQQHHDHKLLSWEVAGQCLFLPSTQSSASSQGLKQHAQQQLITPQARLLKRFCKESQASVYASGRGGSSKEDSPIPSVHVAAA